MVKDWKDFEHEVGMKFEGYVKEGCFKLISKPILKHEADKAPYRVPEYILISDENRIIMFIDCKKNYWQNIDLGSLERLGWAIRAFIENKAEYDLPKNSNVYLSPKIPTQSKIDEYSLVPVLVCTGAEFEFKKKMMELPETKNTVEYTILNFKHIDQFLKLFFSIPTSSSSLETIKKRAQAGELTAEEYIKLLDILKEAGPKHYLTHINIKDDIIKGSEIERVLRFLYGMCTASPIELQKFGEYELNDSTSGGVMIESFKEDAKIYLPLGTEKTADIILKLLNKQIIEIKETSSWVWVLDGAIVQQPHGTKFRGRSIEGEVVAFIFDVTTKGKTLLENIYGGEEKLWDVIFEDNLNLFKHEQSKNKDTPKLLK